MHRNRNSGRNNPSGNAVRPDYRPPMGGGGRSDYGSRHGGQQQGSPYVGAHAAPPPPAATGGLDLLNAYAQVSQLSQQQNLLGLLGALNQSAAAAATTGPGGSSSRSPLPPPQHGREAKPSLLGSPPSLLAMPNVTPTNTFVRATGSSGKRQGERDYSSSQSQGKRPRPASASTSLQDQLRIEEEKLRFQENLLARQIRQVQAAQAATQRPGSSPGPGGQHRHDDRRGGRNDRRNYGGDHQGGDRQQRGGGRNRHQQYRGDNNQNRRRRDDKNNRSADVVPSQDSDTPTVTKVPKIERGPHYCFVCGVENDTSEALDEHKLSAKHVKVIESLKKMAEKSKKPLGAIIDSIDKLRVNKEIEAKLNEMKEEEKEGRAAQSSDGQTKPKRYYCNICSVLFEGNVVAHRQSDEHKKLLAAKEGTSVDDNSKTIDTGAIVSQDKDEKRDLVFGFVIDPAHTQGFRLPRYNPQSAVGADFLEPATGWWCRICHRFYHNEESAKTSHCMTKSHYENVKRYIRDNRTYYPGKEAAAAAAAKEEVPAVEETQPQLPPADDDKPVSEENTLNGDVETKIDTETKIDDSTSEPAEQSQDDAEKPNTEEDVLKMVDETFTADETTTHEDDKADPTPVEGEAEADEPMDTVDETPVTGGGDGGEEESKVDEEVVADPPTDPTPTEDTATVETDATDADASKGGDDYETILSEINDILNTVDEPVVNEGDEVTSSGLVKEPELELDLAPEELDYTDENADTGREEYEPEYPTASDDEEKTAAAVTEEEPVTEEPAAEVSEEVPVEAEAPVVKPTPEKTPRAKCSGKRAGRGRTRGRGVRR